MSKKIVLKNNVRLILSPLKETAAACLIVMFKVGSRYETAGLAGASHFVEHMMFKGTKNRPNTLALSKELDGVGAEYNAYTGKDLTAYYIKADAKHLSLAIDVLADMVLNSKFEEKEVEREKGVIIEELNMYEDNPLMYVDSLLEEALFSGNNLGRLIIGSRKTIKGLNRKSLLAYKNNFYQGKNIVISLAGNFQPEQVKEIEKKFSFTSGTKNKFKPIKISQSRPKIKVKFKETEQAQLALGFPAYSYNHPKINALQLLSVILGGNMSSRLFLQVRERHGLAYFINSSLSVYEDAGGLIIQAGLDKIRIEKAIQLILAELQKIKNGVTVEELKRAKEYIAGKTNLELEDSAYVALWYGQQELLLDKILTPEQKIKKIMAVSREQIKAAARQVIDFKKLSLAVIGPFKGEEKFRKMISGF